MELFYFVGVIAGLVWMVTSAADGDWWWFVAAWACTTWLAWCLWLEINDPRHYGPGR